jgi:hypothetical protein
MERGAETEALPGAPPSADQVADVAGLIADGEDAAAREVLIAMVGDNQEVRDGWLLFAVLQFLRGDEQKALSLFSRSLTSGLFIGNVQSMLNTIVDRRGGAALESFLKNNGMRPSEPVGRLGGELRSKDVDPWAYSPKALNVFPRRQSEFDDMHRLIGRYVLKGTAPAEPTFQADDRIFTLGSCFALELRNYLASRGVNSEWMFVPEGLNNTFAILDFVEWVVTGDAGRDAFWYDEAVEGGALKWTPREEQLVYRQFLETVSGFVLTLGLSEIWYDEDSGGVFWRGVPKSLYDPERHRTRMSEVSENAENLSRTIELLRRVKPSAPIILTLSPVPLQATNRPESCVVADTLSKSILRVAIDQVMTRHGADSGVYYWPSFEVFRGLGANWPEALFGEDGASVHVNRKAVGVLMDHFVDRFWSQPPGPSRRPTD